MAAYGTGWHLVSLALLVPLVGKPARSDKPLRIGPPQCTVLSGQLCPLALLVALLEALALLSSRLTAGGLAIQSPTSPRTGGHLHLMCPRSRSVSSSSRPIGSPLCHARSAESSRASKACMTLRCAFRLPASPLKTSR